MVPLRVRAAWPKGKPASKGGEVVAMRLLCVPPAWNAARLLVRFRIAAQQMVRFGIVFPRMVAGGPIDDKRC